MNDSLLKDIRIVAATWVWAGPWLGAVLADMGAEVIKVESRQKIDNMRYMIGGGAPGPGANPSPNWGGFNVYNRGVKSCTIDLKKPDGVDLFKELVKISDIVIENFPPRVMPDLGLDYLALKGVKPDIIMVSLNFLGSVGPDKDYVAYASTLAAVGGYVSSFGYPGGDPPPESLYLADPIASMYGVIGALSALYYRRKTGKGQHVDISETEGLISVLPEMVMEYAMNKRIRPRMGNRDEIMAPHGCYPCNGNDKWVAVAVSTEEEWQALCRVMGNPEWTKEERFSDRFKRWQNQDDLDKRVAEWTKNFDAYELTRMLQEVGVAAGPSLNVEELVDDRHIRARGAIFEQNHVEAGRTVVYRSPWLSAETGHNRPAPCLGEHNDYVFKDLLNLSDSRVAALVEEKVIY